MQSEIISEEFLDWITHQERVYHINFLDGFFGDWINYDAFIKMFNDPAKENIIKMIEKDCLWKLSMIQAWKTSRN